ncbi:hypothetical protein DAPPUDRAFT_313831 [Daphnia pulex]|uniref:Dysbindin n=1 Tax=Daphnia pulex TaxID=6669 RepID=E9G5E5_DAPPU|nr:hypothetical protein DAPPUDRAFT_313831 [Daphnia pulex]|eukprot:EFX85193.1 hypothetical protein DAPPUDRAFT_313831 [Daphnia pulex]
MLPANLREKLFQVQEELASSLRTLGLTEPISPLVIPSRHGKHFEGVRLDAGADLLNHYQFQWCRMREASDINYHLAEQADKAIASVESYINRQHHLVSTLTTNLSSVSLMMIQLQKITESMSVTEATLKKTEEHLALLEDLVKDSQLESEIKEHDKKFVLLQDQKFAELESLKNHLAATHLQKVREYESKQVLKAKERQAIFEQAFETEIQQYKQSGIIPRMSQSNRQTTSLEEIVVEDDPSSLNQFLDE